MTDNAKKIIIVSILLILAISNVVIIINENNKEPRNGMQEWADQINECTQHYLSEGQSGTCGYIKRIDSEHSTSITVYFRSDNVVDYNRVYIDGMGVIIEWYKRTKDVAVHTSTTYIPFDSICYAQSNEVNQ